MHCKALILGLSRPIEKNKMTLQAMAKLYKMTPRQCTLVRCTERWPQADAQKEPPRKGGFFSSVVCSWRIQANIPPPFD